MACFSFTLLCAYAILLRMKPRPLSSLLFVLTFAVVSLPASAQSLNKRAIQQQLLHKTMLFRGHYACPSPRPCKLIFNRQGELQNKAAVAPFSLGAIYVNRIRFSRGALVILAQGATIVRFSKSSPYQFRAMVLRHQQLDIQIPYTSSQPLELQHSLHAIFFDSLEQALSAGSRQQRQADLNTLPLLAPETFAETEPELKEAGWPAVQTLELGSKRGPKAPKLIYSIPLRYTKTAKKHKIQGKCDFALIVNAHGFPQNIRVIRSLPDGLDEQAIAAVSQYRFRPSRTVKGKPVPVGIIVDVDFHLH